MDINNEITQLIKHVDEIYNKIGHIIEAIRMSEQERKTGSG